MRLQKLIIQNIASIEQAELDFENGPLGQDPIFLICGPTGAGKSTILDAVCLALYNTTPRLVQSANERFLDNDFTGQSEEVGIGDPRMLMRRDSTMASVCLWFTDADDCPLVAEWSVARARGNRTGKIQRISWTLSRQDGTPITTRLSDTRQEIVNRLGLTFEQFSRTALLAQGEFTKFLKSREEDKSDILEKLTGTEIYSRISMEIFARKGEKEEELKRLQAKSEGIVLLTDEQLEALEKESAELDRALREEKDVITRLNAGKKWTDDKRMMEIKLADAQGIYAAACGKVMSEEYVRNKKEVTDWDRTGDARFCLVSRREWKRSQETSVSALEELKAEYVRLLGGERCLRRVMEDTLDAFARTEVFLEAEKPSEAMYRQTQTVVSLEEQILHAVKSVAGYQAQKKELEDGRVAKEKDVRVKRLSYERALAEENGKQKEIDCCHMQWEAMDMEKLKAEKENSERRILEIERLKNALDRRAERKMQYDEAERNLEDVSDECRKLEEKHDMLAERLADARADAGETQVAYDRQKMTCEDWAREARSHLSLGDTCPVCGQKVVVVPLADKEYISLLQPLKELLDKKLLRQEECLKMWQQNEADMKSHIRLKALAVKTKEQAEKAWRQACTVLSECAVYAETGDGKDMGEAVARLERTERERHAALQKRWEEADALQQKCFRLQKEKDCLSMATEKARRNWELAEKEIMETDAAIRNLANAIVRERTAVETAERRVDPMLASDGWRRLRREDAMEFMKKLQENAGRYADAENRHVYLRQRLEQLGQEKARVEETKGFILQSETDWQGLLAVSEETADGLPERWNALRASVVSERRTLLQARSKLEEADRMLAAFHASHPDVVPAYLEKLADLPNGAVEKARVNVRKAEEELIARQTELKRSAEELEQHLQKRPDLPDTATSESLQEEIRRHEDRMSEMTRRYGAVLQTKKEHAENAERMRTLMEQIEVKRKETDGWRNLSALFGSADGKKFRNIAQSYVLRQLLAGANHYLSRLTDRYRMECQPGSLTILLRDDYQGGICRPTSTISGGESFLVSLSLALGLSSLNRRSLSVDTLFIDEGFGTLDGDYLNTVMESLERLHQMGGRRVGIISHVESLRERIHTQIHVERVNSTLSRIEVTTLC